MEDQEPKAVTWRCPRCRCSENGCGGDDEVKGKDACMSHSTCLGFICECPEGDWEHPQTADHGTKKEPCETARCYHCGWEGTFPKGSKKPLTEKTKKRRRKLRLRVKSLEETVSGLLKRVDKLEKSLKNRK